MLDALPHLSWVPICRMLCVKIYKLQPNAELIQLHQECKQFVQHCVHSDWIQVILIELSKVFFFHALF